MAVRYIVLPFGGGGGEIVPAPGGGKLADEEPFVPELLRDSCLGYCLGDFLHAATSFFVDVAPWCGVVNNVVVVVRLKEDEELCGRDGGFHDVAFRSGWCVISIYPCWVKKVHKLQKFLQRKGGGPATTRKPPQPRRKANNSLAIIDHQANKQILPFAEHDA